MCCWLFCVWGICSFYIHVGIFRYKYLLETNTKLNQCLAIEIENSARSYIKNMGCIQPCRNRTPGFLHFYTNYYEIDLQPQCIIDYLHFFSVLVS